MLEVQLVGKFEVKSDGKSIEIPSRPAQSLLAYRALMTAQSELADQASRQHPGLWFFGLNPSAYSYLYARKQEARRLADKIVQSLQS